MSDNKLSIISEKFENEKGEQVEGITIIIDGKLKDMFDIIIAKESIYSDYKEVIRDVLFSGINNYIEKYKSENNPSPIR
jgi:DNA-binding protein YbaB